MRRERYGMEHLIYFALQTSAMSLLAAMAEHLIPDGALKKSAVIGIGLAFVAVIASKLIGIFDGAGV